MQIEDYHIAPRPDPEQHHQWYGLITRTYWVEHDDDGSVTLHPARGYAADRRTGDVVYVDTYSIGTQSGKNKSRRIYARDLERGDLLKAPWPPHEDEQRFPFARWEYSQLAALEIKNGIPSNPYWK